MAKWLGLCALNAGGEGLIPGWGIKLPYTACRAVKKKKGKKINKKVDKRLEWALHRSISKEKIFEEALHFISCF